MDDGNLLLWTFDTNTWTTTTSNWVCWPESNTHTHTHTTTPEAFSLSHASAVDQFFTHRTTSHFSCVVVYFQFDFLIIVSRFEENFPPSTSDELQPMTKVNYIRLTGFSSFSFLEKANCKRKPERVLITGNRSFFKAIRMQSAVRYVRCYRADVDISNWIHDIYKHSQSIAQRSN